MRPCVHPGCPVLTERTRCTQHERQRERQRGSPTARGLDAGYQRERRALLADDPPCWRCGAPATTADHIVPRAHGGTNDRDNLRPACLRCNASTGATVRREGPKG